MAYKKYPNESALERLERIRRVRNATQKRYREKRKAESKPAIRGKSGTTHYRQSDPRDRALQRLRARYFVAWDSEGVTFPKADDPLGDHRLVFIANSLGDELENEHGLIDFESRIVWLFEKAFQYDANAVHVFFSATYDWTMFLRGMPEKDLKRVYESSGKFGTWFNIGTSEYDIRVSFRRYLKIRRVSGINSEGRRQWDTVQFLDVFGFFQSSFLTAIEANLGLDYPELEKIREGKLQRATAPKLDDPMREYCRAELRALVKLCERLRDHMSLASIPISNFWGAGSIAAALLKWGDVKQHQNLQPTEREKDRPYYGRGKDYHLPDYFTLQDAILHAFFGGRIEMLKFGHHLGDIYDDDLNSAYPYAMSLLPSFHPENGEWIYHGGINARQLHTLEWKHKRDYYKRESIDASKLSDFSLLHVRYQWRGDSKDKRKDIPFHPFPCRDYRGSIYYPEACLVWIHKCEYDAAQKAGQENPLLKAHTLDVIEAWEWKQNSKGLAINPWHDFITEKFELRKRLKESHGKGGPEKIVKLGINSVYGKCAQRIGWESKSDGTFNLPPYQDLYMAGFITAKTRSMLYARAAQNPSAVISFATDGITSTAELSHENLGENLGQWERTRYDDGIFVMPGVYILSRDEKAVKNMVRGFHPRMTADEWRAHILERWHAGELATVLPQTVFHTLGLSVLRGKLETLGQWETIQRDVELSCIGSKRYVTGKNSDPSLGLVDTLPNSLECDADNLISHLSVPPEIGSFPPSHPSRAQWLEAIDNDTQSLLSMKLEGELEESCALEAERYNELE